MSVHNKRHVILTPRKIRILQLKLENKSTMQIANELDISFYTVKDHVKQLKIAGVIDQFGTIDRRKMRSTNRVIVI